MPFKIRTKLILAFLGLTLVLLSVTGIVGYYSQMASREAFQEVEEISKEVRIAGDMQLIFESARTVWLRLWIIMGVSAVMLIFLGIAFAVFYSGLFVKPIHVIRNGADAIAAGNFKTRLDIKTGDEIGQLANAMNEMAAQLEGFYSTLEDQVRERTRGLQESEERFRQLFQGGNDAIFVHHIMPDGGPGKFIEVNNLACERLGFTREEFLNMSPLDIDAPDMSVSREVILKDFAEKKHAIFEMVHMTKDGRRIPVEVNAHIFELSGEPMVLSIVRDITERKEAEEKLKRNLDDLKRMNKMMVDREIRMIELKKENQRLRDEAGKKSS